MVLCSSYRKVKVRLLPQSFDVGDVFVGGANGEITRMIQERKGWLEPQWLLLPGAPADNYIEQGTAGQYWRVSPPLAGCTRLDRVDPRICTRVEKAQKSFEGIIAYGPQHNTPIRAELTSSVEAEVSASLAIPKNFCISQLALKFHVEVKIGVYNLLWDGKSWSRTRMFWDKLRPSCTYQFPLPTVTV